jgi:hypothetical protein
MAILATTHGTSDYLIHVLDLKSELLKAMKSIITSTMCVDPLPHYTRTYKSVRDQTMYMYNVPA